MSSFVLADAPLHPNPELEPINFALEDVYYRLLVPKRSRLSHINSPGCVKIWHPRATRLMTFLELCSASGEIPSAFAKQTTLTNGARVHSQSTMILAAGAPGLRESLGVGLISMVGSSS